MDGIHSKDISVAESTRAGKRTSSHTLSKPLFQGARAAKWPAIPSGISLWTLPNSNLFLLHVPHCRVSPFHKGDILLTTLLPSPSSPPTQILVSHVPSCPPQSYTQLKAKGLLMELPLEAFHRKNNDSPWLPRNFGRMKGSWGRGRGISRQLISFKISPPLGVGVSPVSWFIPPMTHQSLLI